MNSPRFSLRQRNEHQELPSVRHEIELPPVLGLHEALDRKRSGLSAGGWLPEIHRVLKQLARTVEVQGLTIGRPERVRAPTSRELISVVHIGAQFILPGVC